MNSIIKVQNIEIGAKSVNSVNARELHRDIESKRQYSHWITNRIKKYNFIENKDYIIIETKKDGNNANLKDYIITLDMAKELAMVENNLKGREVREYFIEIEKKYQAKLLKDSERQKTILENEKSKNRDLLVDLSTCKEKLKVLENEKNYIKSNALLKFENMQLEVSKTINKFNLLKLKSLNKNPIPQNRFFEIMEALLSILVLNSQTLAEDFN